MIRKFKIESLSGSRIVIVETQPANGDTSYTVYHSTPESELRVSGILDSTQSLKKFITKQSKFMWIKVTSVTEIS